MKLPKKFEYFDRTEYLLNGQFHREDGPAIIQKDVSEEWYLNGVPHREGGPAFTDKDGTKRWCRHGEFHREGWPARIDNDGGEGVVPSWLASPRRRTCGYN